MTVMDIANEHFDINLKLENFKPRLMEAISACCPAVPRDGPVSETNWVPIVGGPSCGKTTMIRSLMEAGFNKEETSGLYNATFEMAREVIASARHAGFKVEDCFKVAYTEMQYTFAGWQYYRDIALAATPEIRALQLVLDRGCCDAAAHMEAEGLSWTNLEPLCRAFKYKAVMLLESLPLVKDGSRPQDQNGQERVARACRKVYEQCGHNVINIPVMPEAERTAHVIAILRRLRNQ